MDIEKKCPKTCPFRISRVLDKKNAIHKAGTPAADSQGAPTFFVTSNPHIVQIFVYPGFYLKQIFVLNFDHRLYKKG